ncbi:MAG: ABC transporter ATP-binding protein [Planctomycetaceae bacterium]
MIARPPKKQLTAASTYDREDDKRPLDFRLIARLMSFTNPYRAKRNWLAVIVLIRSVQLPGLTWILSAVINGPIERSDVDGVMWGMIAFAVLALSTQLVMHFRQRYAYELGEAVVHDLRNALFAHLQKMPMSFFYRTKVGRVISRMTSDIEDVRVGVQEVLYVSLVQIGQMCVATAFMLYYSPPLFLVVLGLVPILWLLNRYFHRRLSKALRAMRESFSRVTATLAESVLGIRVTQGFVRQDENARIFTDLVTFHSANNFKVLKTHGLFLPLLELNNQFFIALLMLIGGFRVLNPDSGTGVGELVGFLFMANLFLAPITNLGNQYNQAMTAMAGAERLFKLLDTPPEWSDSETACDLPRMRGEVEFREITFGYDPDRPVLHDVSFSVQPGQMVALVGHTGSGKSTIVNLIAKFSLAQKGRILIDGYDLHELKSASIRRQLGVVLQQNFLFTGTLGDNIRFSKPDATDDELRAVLKKLECDDMLPADLNTEVGERGNNLSLGQRQLICFARAMLADPRILILDEATSSIDSITEARIQKALAILLKGRTSFVVAHRLSTIRHADLVLVLDHGKIVERGRHAELLKQRGTYEKLYKRFIQPA